MHSPRSHTSAIRAHLGAASTWLRARATPRHRGRTATAAGTGPLVRAQARVPTDRSARYAKQLCSHAAWKTPHAQWTEPHGVIEFPDGAGTCRITAEPDCLILAVEAAGPEDLERIQQILGSNIERFAAREHLTVQWTPA
ncbi:DUF2218 domain-containing protein [Streptacidiphilus cavernicola]|uniref:DUF2218 domain-containing protein n=1 Tax=Streptacidiphilus cavernicola TaxID=3342716 RepID=A0ABV6VW65_9ACTN